MLCTELYRHIKTICQKTDVNIEYRVLMMDPMQKLEMFDKEKRGISCVYFHFLNYC